MGPSDPFTEEREAVEERVQPGPRPFTRAKPSGPVVGALLGVTIALLVLLFGAWSAVFVVALGLGGAALGWLVTRLGDRLDVRGGWAALLRREPDETQH